MTVYDAQTLEKLWEGKLSSEELRTIQSRFKDRDRFQKFLQYCQDQVNWEERILLPLQPHLYIVEKRGGERIVKCDCGHEFGDYRENWKLEARILVRDSNEAMQELYPPLMHGDPQWMEMREFICPGCFTLLEVDLAPPGYPILHDFQPDLEVFQQEWLCKEQPKG